MVVIVVVVVVVAHRLMIKDDHERIKQRNKWRPRWRVPHCRGARGRNGGGTGRKGCAVVAGAAGVSEQGMPGVDGALEEREGSGKTVTGGGRGREGRGAGRGHGRL